MLFKLSVICQEIGILLSHYSLISQQIGIDIKNIILYIQFPILFIFIIFCFLYFRVQNMKIIDGKPEYKNALVCHTLYINLTE